MGLIIRSAFVIGAIAIYSPVHDHVGQAEMKTAVARGAQASQVLNETALSQVTKTMAMASEAAEVLKALPPEARTRLLSEASAYLTTRPVASQPKTQLREKQQN